MKKQNNTYYKLSWALAIVGILGVIAVRMALPSAIKNTGSQEAMNLLGVIVTKFDIYLLMTLIPIVLLELIFIRMIIKNKDFMTESLQRTIMIAVSSAGVFNLIYSFIYAKNNALEAFDWTGYLFLLAVCETLTLSLVLGYKAKYFPKETKKETEDFSI